MADFGKTAIGGTGATLTADWKKFTKFTAPSDIGEVDSISAYLNRTSSGGGYGARGGIYTDNAGAPDALVSNSAIEIVGNISKNNPQWYSKNYTVKPTLTPDAVYWIGIQAEKDSRTYYDVGGTNQTALNADEYNALDDPFGTPAGYGDQEHSFYVSYTPSVGAYYHGLKVQGVGELALCDVGSNPLRIRKGGVTYGIELVNTGDANASAVRIKTGAGVKAIRKYT